MLLELRGGCQPFLDYSRYWLVVYHRWTYNLDMNESKSGQEPNAYGLFIQAGVTVCCDC